MKKYKVFVERIEVECWEVEASSEQEARECYTEGDVLWIKTKDETVVEVKEDKE